MHDERLHRARIVASVAATVISLACGTNYGYSAWGPQFAERLKLSATQSNLIGLSANLGMYSLGIPVGMFVDGRGPRPAVLAGALFLGLGYSPLRVAYDRGSGSLFLLCFFSFLSGLGGCTAFAAAVKTSALNWPHHRGTATAFPLAAFGLSAFFFSVLGSLVPGDPSAYLMILAIGTFALCFVGYFFLQVIPHTSKPYQTLRSSEAGLNDSQLLRRTASQVSKSSRNPLHASEPGTSSEVSAGLAQIPNDDVETSPAAAMSDAVSDDETDDLPYAPHREVDETSSLISDMSSLPGDVLLQGSVDLDRSHRIDIRGVRMLPLIEFWQLFCILGLLSGIGLMTINNIGNDVRALWKVYDPTMDDKGLVRRQQMHVSILSLCSFTGRLLSGVGSDFLVKWLHASRLWCLVVASVIFSIAQLFALGAQNPVFLPFVSGLTGLGYGFLFGVFPTIVAETFGIHGLSQNWGFMTLAPIISGNVFNLFYGVVYDSYSTIGPSGERTCEAGRDCYWAAYVVTLVACITGLTVTLWVIWYQEQKSNERADKGEEED